MQYKSITYKRVIVPKSYESKTLEVTVELNEEDNPNKVTRQLMKQVEDLIQTHYDELDGEHLIAINQELEKAQTFKSALKNLDNIHF